MLYEGIDFANIQKNIGHCYVADDGNTLQAEPNRDHSQELKLRAVDCPLGVCFGFSGLLAGNLPQDIGGDGYKTRTTERWLRNHATNYQTNRRWQNRTPAENAEFARVSYFNGGAHVQSAAGLQIVPACIAWLSAELSADLEPAQRLLVAGAARRGESEIIEAHPRMLLYSAVERIHKATPNGLTAEVLNFVAGYKENGEVGVERRRRIYQLLQENPDWMGKSQRAIHPVAAPNWLVETDHVFDAWLAALTAWAHEHSETLTWLDAGLDEEAVKVEGHILVLK